ncbi:MAG: right-handed parallel beta-helix repeat-containing protein, partial [Kiritimatiellae bacterium]|nr:right-handed parallel beta-helix repeat-containing protein [Kiritimatiellia bacterium]
MKRRTRLGWGGLCAGLVLCGRASLGVDYYVNDTNTAGDVWCAAAGHATNSGLTADSPALGVQAVLDAYDLGGGDTVYVDSGDYLLAQNISIGLEDGGSSTDAVVRVRGAGADLTVLDRGTRGGSAYGIHLNGAPYVVIEDLRLTNAAQAVRIENATNITVRGCELDRCGLGVVLSAGSGHVVDDCTIHHNDQQALMGSSSAAPVLTGNAFRQSLRGVELFDCGAAQIAGNVICSNASHGVYLSSCSAAALTGNVVFANGEYGEYLASCGGPEVRAETVCLNTNGLYCGNCTAPVLDGTRVYSNLGVGMRVEAGVAQVRRNLVYANGGVGLDMANVGAATLENNTAYANAAVGLKLWGNYQGAQVRNNVLAATEAGQTCVQVENLTTAWSSDYNALWVTNGAGMWDWQGARYTLAWWQRYADKDRHSLDADPLFVDPDGADDVLGGTNGTDDDFHLQSTAGSWHGGAWTADGSHSLGVDAGDPESAYADEPAPNGARVNLGCYGGTAEASKSGGQRAVRVLYPDGGEIGFRCFRVRWACQGPWTSNDYVKIEYSPNAGGLWLDCANANPLDHDNGIYVWDISGFATGTQYRVRVTFTDDEGVTDASDEVFEILGPEPRALYVNDGSTAGDEWCSATGSVANTGLSPNSPLESFQTLLERYPQIGAGDDVRIDAGTYALAQTVYVDGWNSGVAGTNLVIRGTAAGTTVWNRGDAGKHVVRLQDVDHLRVQDLGLADGYDGLKASNGDGVEVMGCEVYSNAHYGIYLSACTNALVQSNGCHFCADAGIRFENSSGDVVGNKCEGSHHSEGRGISVYNVVGNVVGNECHGNENGMFVRGTVVIEGNVCHTNNQIGIQIETDCDVSGNRVYENGGGGLLLGYPWSPRVHGNIVYGNGGCGVNAEYGGQIRNNLVYENRGYNLRVAASPAQVENNTLYGGCGLWLCSPSSVTNRNNVIWATGAGNAALRLDSLPAGLLSDYNDLYATDGASVGYYMGARPTLRSWREVTGRDSQSVSIDPLFVDMELADLHLSSAYGSYRGNSFTAPGGGYFTNDALTSFCVDGGAPDSAYGNESADNGGRVNMGAFGNTGDASRSPNERLSLLVEPNGDVKLFGVQTIIWLTRGAWSSNDTVKLEYSDDGGDNWDDITNGIAYAAGTFEWDTAGLTPGTNYLVRVSNSGDATGSDSSDTAFEIAASGPRIYYVNDGSTTGDVWCTAIGDNGNDGLAPETPKGSVQSVLDTYNLEGGDTVRIDTGSYPLDATVLITTNDMGSPGSPVTFVGSVNGSVLSGPDTTNCVVYANGASHLRLEKLELTGGKDGIRLEGCDEVEVVNCTASQNGGDGIRISDGDGIWVEGCLSYSNGQYGVYLGNCTNALVQSNGCHFCDTGIRLENTTGDVIGNECEGSRYYDGYSLCWFGWGIS